MSGNRIVIEGTSLTCAEVARIARADVPVAVSDAGMARARRAAEAAMEAVSVRPVYGRTTGVGANRLVGIAGEDADAHGLRLIRSHASGAGPLLGAEPVRAMLAVRLNQ